MYDWNEVFKTQTKLQERIFGSLLFTEDQIAEYIRNNVLAATDELHEAMRVNGWKPWSTKRHFHPERTAEELIDALHFLINLFILCGWDADDVYDAFMTKNAINFERQDNGY